jgi:hypothetical protein
MPLAKDFQFHPTPMRRVAKPDHYLLGSFQAVENLHPEIPETGGKDNKRQAHHRNNIVWNGRSIADLGRNERHNDQEDGNQNKEDIGYPERFERPCIIRLCASKDQ